MVRKNQSNEILVNLTQQDIDIMGDYGQVLYHLPATPRQAAKIYFDRNEYVRLKQGSVLVSHVNPVRITGVPEPEGGVYYVVSSVIAQHLRRSDVFSPDTAPGGAVRDRNTGKIIGVKGLQAWHDPDEQPVNNSETVRRLFKD